MKIPSATKGRDGKWGEVVPPLEDADYGRFRVYPRTDGKFTVFDPHDPLEVVAAAPAFPNEGAARDWAKAMATPKMCRRCGDPLMPEEDAAGCGACAA